MADMGEHRQDGYGTKHRSADMDLLARWLDLLVPSLCVNFVWCCSPMIPPNPCFGVFDVGARYYYNVGLFWLLLNMWLNQYCLHLLVGVNGNRTCNPWVGSQVFYH